MNSRTVATTLFLLSLAIYALFSYGGVRSPDSEIVFRTSEALATTGHFALERDLELWPGFGAPVGLDGRQYSVFGPGQPLAAVPLVRLGQALDRTRWYEGHERAIPTSHYCGTGVTDLLAGRTPADVEQHALRFLVSFFNTIVSAAAVAAYFALLVNLTGSVAASGTVAFLFAFGSPLFPYSGTFFSEPLALLFSLLAFGLAAGRRPLVREDAASTPGAPRAEALLAGLCLGCAAATHLSALLFAPFFARIAVHRALTVRATRGRAAGDVALFAAGFLLVLALLGWHNLARFGGLLETGRTVGDYQAFAYGEFVNPWPGLVGLTVSSGKGLLWFFPPAVLGVALWGRFWRRDAVLAATVLAMVLFRVAFVAARSDWHGGFAIGPRYLLLAVPFLLLPCAYWVADLLAARRWLPFACFVAFVAAAAALQLSFAVGEFSTFLHGLNFAEQRRGIDVFDGNQLYFRWAYSPLGAILDGRRGPWALQGVPGSNRTLWLVASGLLAAAAGLWSARMWSPGRRDAARDAVSEPEAGQG